MTDIILEKAKGGCKDSMWKIKGEFVSLIHTLSDKNRNAIRDIAKFEEGCFRRIEYAVTTYNGSKSRFFSFVFRTLTRYLSSERERYRYYRRGFETIGMSYRNEDGEEVEIEIVDILADVENEVLNGTEVEKIALLAEGDPRRLAVLNAWKQGCYNDSDLALLLAKQHGGKSESHRKFISRFRAKCQTALADAI